MNKSLIFGTLLGDAWIQKKIKIVRSNKKI